MENKAIAEKCWYHQNSSHHVHSFISNKNFERPFVQETENGWNICDVLSDLLPFVQFKNVENTHGGVLLLAKVQAFSLQFY